jgi:hypothetical protein
MPREAVLSKLLGGWVALGYLGVVSGFLNLFAVNSLATSASAGPSRTLIVELAILNILIGGLLALAGVALRRAWSVFRACGFLAVLVLSLGGATVVMVGVWFLGWVEGVTMSTMVVWSAMYLALIGAGGLTLVLIGRRLTADES